jgi:transcriptional repressor NrdR
MKCPYCGHSETAVIDSRESEENDAIRRRRSCQKCEKRFTTFEKVQGLELKVIKKDGEREDFDREKLKRGIVKATWKRPVSMSDIDDLLEDVERKLRCKQSNEVKSWEIGNLVINRLKKIDALSYLLFASVYRDFDSLDDFAEEIDRLRNPQLESDVESGKKSGEYSEVSKVSDHRTDTSK